MNWDMLIYAGLAAAAAGFMTAFAVFIELKIPETAAFLSGRSRRKGADRIRKREAVRRASSVPDAETEQGGHFILRRRILSAWPEGISDTENESGNGQNRRTEPLTERTEDV